GLLREIVGASFERLGCAVEGLRFFQARIGIQPEPHFLQREVKGNLLLDNITGETVHELDTRGTPHANGRDGYLEALFRGDRQQALGIRRETVLVFTKYPRSGLLDAR